MEHVFGPVPIYGLGPNERLCNEPFVPNGKAIRTYHIKFEMSATSGGDFVCVHCGLSFLHGDRITS